MPSIPALGRQRRRISEFEASLVYRVSSRRARATRETLSGKTKKKKKKKKKKETNKKPDHQGLLHLWWL
jgi:hypothetical protein